MVYQDVFFKWYGKPNEPEKCWRRGRSPKHCPGKEILERLLTPIYGPYLRLSECESSVSLTTRPDPLFSVLRQRATRQVYIFGETGLMRLSWERWMSVVCRILSGVICRRIHDGARHFSAHPGI